MGNGRFEKLLGRWFFGILIILLGMQGCRRPSSTENQTDPTLVAIGGTKATLEEFTFFIKKSYPELSIALDDEMQSQMLDRFVEDLLIAEFARNTGLRVTHEQISEFVDGQMTTITFNLLPEKEQQLWVHEIGRRLAIQEFLKREILDRLNINDNEISDYYQKNRESFKTEQRYQVRIIQFDEQKKVDACLNEMKSSKDPITVVAAKYTENEGYKFPVVQPLNFFDEPLQKVIKKLRPGSYSSAIPLEFEKVTLYHIVYLESVIEETDPSFEEVYLKIRQKLEAQAAQNLLSDRVAQLRKIMKVSINQDALPFQYVPISQRSEK